MKSAEQAAEFKRKAQREIKEMITMFLYLAFFFCALTTYSMLLLDEFHLKAWNYSFALINAAVVMKVVLLGEAAKVGTRYEERPLLLSALYKALVFSVLVMAVHFLEEFTKRLMHGTGFREIPSAIRMDELLSRTLVVFCTFISLFGYREFRRVLGEEKFFNLLFRSEAAGR